MKTRRRDPLGRKNNYPLWARCCLLKRQNALVGGASRRSGSIPARFTAGYLLRWLASNPRVFPRLDAGDGSGFLG